MQQKNGIELVYNPNQQTKVEHAIIWLHGLGATANDFPPVVPELGLDPQRAIRFIFPQAPERPITINGGMRMPGWYDIKGMSIDQKEDLQGMRESQAILETLLEQQVARGVPSEHIIVAGFSQGGAVAYYTALRSQHKLAGLLALSTYLPFAQQAAEQHSAVNTAMTVFASHGDYDPVVPVALGQASVTTLQALGYQVNWKTYPMEHQVSLEQLRDIGAWINQTYSSE
ncbi:MAG: dienelactone hydrolase family protein [Gammaproteobacteria bacterium]|nr:dienelactone hydrolase family protein [Gammaproteobacteria bacterium]